MAKKKKSLVRRIIKYFSLTLLFLLIILISIPFIFKDKIVQLVKDETNSSVNATVDFGEFDLTVFSSFPNLSLTVNDVSIDGKDVFKGVRLAGIQKLDMTIDLWSLMSDKYKIISVDIEHPDIYVKVLKDGTANYDIAIASDDTIATTPAEESSFALALESYKIENGHIIYDDASLGIYTEFEGLSHQGHGDITSDLYTLSLETGINAATVIYDGVTYLNKVEISNLADVEIDNSKSLYTLANNSLQLNKLSLTFNGWIAMNSDDIDMDLRFETDQNDLKQLLSLIPALYTPDFADVKATGDFTFNGFVKGKYNETSMPAFNTRMVVKEGSFRYAGMPQGVTGINVDATVNSPEGNNMDNMTVKIPKFHAEVLENTLDATLDLSHSMTNPEITSSIKCFVDLASIGSFYRLYGDEKYSGIINADITLGGKMSSLDEERYDEFKAEGAITVQNVNYSDEKNTYTMAIDSMRFNFSPQLVSMPVFVARTGKTDISANGEIDNYLQYALKDEMLTGTFNVQSNLLNLNEFMGSNEETTPETTEQTVTDSTSYGIIEVPGNIDFTLATRTDELFYENISIKNVIGMIVVKDRVATLKDLHMNMLQGEVTLNGTYSTPDVNTAITKISYNLRNLDIEETSIAFSGFVDKMAPIAKKCKGKFSSFLDMSMALDNNMMPDYNTLSGTGDFNSKEMYISGFEPLNKLASALKIEKLSKQNIADVFFNFTIKDGKIIVDEFPFKMGKNDASMAGFTTIEQDINYMMNIKIPRSEFGGAANQVLDNLVSSANNKGAAVSVGDIVPVDVKFTGKVTDPKISTTFSQEGQGLMDNVKEQLQNQLDSAKQKVEDVIKQEVNDVKEDLSAQADKILADAEVKAQAVRDNAATAAQKIKDEGYKKAQDVEDGGKGNLLKAKAAKIAADKIRKQTDDKAAKTITEGNSKADAIMTKAHEEVDKLK